MIILFILLLAISLIGCKIYRFNENYISYDNSNAIKGILALIILFSHMKGYITLSDNFYDQWFSDVLVYIGQLMVAPYFFYSGYGIMESIARKPSYMQSYPRRRILKTMINFDVAVLIYVIVMTIIGTYYPGHYYLSCWIGWDSVGNSNWFIFDILILYVLFYISYKLSNYLFPSFAKSMKMKQFVMLFLFSVIVVIMWGALFIANKGSWWIDTLLTFPLGAWYSYFRSYFEKQFRKGLFPAMLLFVLLSLFIIWKQQFGNDVLGVTACIFCLLLMVVCTKVEINNKYLQWFGIHAFSIYIIQRLPMNLFAHFGLDENPYLFAALSIPSVLFCSYIYNRILTRLDARI